MPLSSPRMTGPRLSGSVCGPLPGVLLVPPPLRVIHRPGYCVIARRQRCGRTCPRVRAAARSWPVSDCPGAGPRRRFTAPSFMPAAGAALSGVRRMVCGLNHQPVQLGVRPATSWRSAGLEFACGGPRGRCAIVGAWDLRRDRPQAPARRLRRMTRHGCWSSRTSRPFWSCCPGRCDSLGST